MIFTEIEFEAEDRIINFKKISNIADFWIYLDSVFLEMLHGSLLKWGNRSEAINFKADFYNYILGPPRLRQIRIKPTSCRGNSYYLKYFPICYGEYSSKHEETTSMYKGSKYISSEGAGSYFNAPLQFEYHGGGYIENMDFDLETNINLIEKLRDSMWIDRGTRLVVVEFGVFNGNKKMYCEVK